MVTSGNEAIHITLNTGASNQALGTISIPDWSGTLTKAFLKAYIHTLEDTSTADNFVSSRQWIQCKNVSSPSYINAIPVIQFDLRTQANQMRPGIILHGTEDIKAEVEKGGNLQLQWTNAQVNGDDLEVWGLHFEAVLILK